MAESARCTMYERFGFTPAAAEGIRPGGLALTDRALAFCRFAPGSPLLDIGCGNGVTLHHLESVHRLRPVGIDSSSLLAAEAQRKTPSLPVILGCADKLPFDTDSFEGVILECTFSLIEDQPGALDECYRVLRPEGRLIISDLYARNPTGIPELRSLARHCCLRGALDSAELRERVSSAGFEIDLWEDHSDLLREFAVQIVWTYGSMETFWELANEQATDENQIQEAIRQSRPGYFLLVARATTRKKDVAVRKGPACRQRGGRE